MPAALKVVLTVVLAAAAVLVGAVSLNSTDVTCGGETMHAGDRCVTSAGSRGRDEQQSESDLQSWLLVAGGGVVLLGMAGYGIFTLNERRRR
ncbi:hypothetical protein SAMN04489730_6345 [Amycolatopsis australiensis]|uniref:MYXO-CTERM domain-containing protein n=1 Tax=Amycolatopsis australiensis TaxID=546364 RepID=A0A1K1SPQ7_9PSEU|nr:hypothetical protein SAMN04489730_6345 [Amycolatopsis australiensis]